MLAAPVQAVGDEPSLVGVRAGDAVAWVRAALGRARPAAAPSHALLGLAQSVFLEHHSRTCVSPQHTAVSWDRWLGGDGVGCVVDGAIINFRPSRIGAVQNRKS